MTVSREKFELVALANGVRSLRAVANGQTFHPVVGPAAEARAVHLAGTRLVERANAAGAGGFTIWDVGLGAAANALAALDALMEGYTGLRNVSLLSFDRTLAALDFALEHESQLEYLSGTDGLFDMLCADGTLNLPFRHSLGTLDWRLYVEDFPALLASSRMLEPPNAVFFDPYSPTVNPEMWTLDLFKSLHAQTRESVPCLLTTYTRSTAVRVTLLLAGFYVGIGHATGEKDETTIAANQLELLQRPLDRNWLDNKVVASTNAAPLRSSVLPVMPSPIGTADLAALRAHRQFA